MYSKCTQSCALKHVHKDGTIRSHNSTTRDFTTGDLLYSLYSIGGMIYIYRAENKATSYYLFTPNEPKDNQLSVNTIALVIIACIEYTV